MVSTAELVRLTLPPAVPPPANDLMVWLLTANEPNVRFAPAVLASVTSVVDGKVFTPVQDSVPPFIVVAPG